MERHQHVLSSVGKKQYPDVVVAVQCDMNQVYLSESDAVGSLELERWCMVASRVNGSNVDWGNLAHGKSVKLFWRELRKLTKYARQAWIVSFDARDHAAALDLWGLLGSGELTLTGADPYYRDSGDDSNRPRRDGYIVLESPPTVICFKWHDSDAVLTWVDPQNYGAGKVIAAQAVDYDCGETFDPTPDMPAVINQAAEATLFAVSEWIAEYFHCLAENNLNGPEHTAASQAMSGFRYRYLDERVVIHDSEPALRLERAALHGGRCECRYLGELFADSEPGEIFEDNTANRPVRSLVGPIYHLDVNSLYPSMAHAYALPVELRAIVKHTSTPVILEAAKACAVICQAHVETSVPCVPVANRGITIFPTGSFTTELCGPELLLAHSLGAKMKIVWAAVYASKKIYSSWVRDLYAKKLEYQRSGNRMMRSAVKAILNASFGKWAQLSKRWVDDDDILPRAPYCQWFGLPEANGLPVQYRAMAWHVQRLEVAGEPGDSFPAITAYINSLGRVRLWSLLQTAGMDNVYYYDTDSIFCNQAGYDALDNVGQIDQDALGCLSLRGQYRHVRFMGRQAYVADGKLTLSACRDPHTTATSTYGKCLKTPPIQHYLLKDESPGLDRMVTKVNFAREYKHGHVQPDGTVLPIVISPRPAKT